MGYIKRAVSFILAAALIAPAFPPVRAEGGTHVLRRDAFTLGAELSYASQTVVHPSAGREEERTLILPAGHGLTPLAVSGGFVYGNGITVKDAAALLAARGYDVVAGVNGGFFNTSDATPIGLLVENGVLKADEGWVPAIGFTSSGGMIIGKPGLSFSFTARGVTKKIDHLNQVRDRDRLFLYTPEFSETTRTTRQGTHAVLAVNGGGPLRIGGTLDCTVRAVLTGTQAHTIAPDEVVLSATSEEPVSRIANLVPGDAVSISVTCEDLRWLDVTQAVGGRTMLVSDGAINPNLEPGRGPQTCAGLRPDGTAVFLTVDGRQSGYSEGYTLEQTAVRMLELGCVTALELDGGGSTAIGVSYPGKTEFTLVNKPSDGRQRKCSDYIFFVNEKPRTGLPAVLHPYPKDGSLIVRGGTMDFDTYAADINGHAVNTPGDVFFFAPSGAVSAEGGGILFDTPGENTVEAFSPSFGIWGDAAVTVTDTLDTFSVTLQGQTAALTGLALTPGGTAALSASGTKDGFPVAMGGGVVWSYEGEAGILDEQNIFTAAGRSLALGSISAAAGDKSVTLPVRVGTEGLVLEDFEKSVFPLPEPGMGVSAGFARYAQSAARGEKAAETALDFSAPDALSAAPDALYLPLGFALSGAPDFVSFYARGDTGALSLEVTDAAGALHLLPAGTPENAGYGTFTLKLPANAAFVNGLFISRTEGGAETGTLLIDHFVQHWTSSADETAPDIRLLETLEDGDTVTHRV
ncbi:MAG: phosphodiester glycosidase family protein, partial [Oscillospiraceae bacterium]|nr:phosphodiester glycosidase family protein [Oscillospiraceae bacterium]